MKIRTFLILLLYIFAAFPVMAQESGDESESPDSQNKNQSEPTKDEDNHSIRVLLGAGKGSYNTVHGQLDSSGMTQGAILASLINGPTNIPIALDGEGSISPTVSWISLEYRYKNQFQIFFSKRSLYNNKKTPTLETAITYTETAEFSQPQTSLSRSFGKDDLQIMGLGYFPVSSDIFRFGFNVGFEKQKHESSVTYQNNITNKVTDYRYYSLGNMFNLAHNFTGITPGIVMEIVPVDWLELKYGLEKLSLKGNVEESGYEMGKIAPPGSTMGDHIASNMRFQASGDSRFEGLRHTIDIGIKPVNWFVFRIGRTSESAKVKNGMVLAYQSYMIGSLNDLNIGFDFDLSGQSYRSKKELNYLLLEFRINF